MRIFSKLKALGVNRLMVKVRALAKVLGLPLPVSRRYFT